MTKHANISIFVAHVGCPNMCSFCNQHTISGCKDIPTADKVSQICKEALSAVASPENTQIAFFGGSFTAIEREYMISLLEAASEYVGEGKFSGIRISTRPDAIDDEVLRIHKSYGVTAIELGAQSMSDEVLSANDRGHTAEDVIKASELIKSYGFELGLQMMTGLYKSSESLDIRTAQEIIKLRPDTVRIYPTVILEGTRLSELYKSGEYKTMEFDEMVKLCAKLLLMFHKENISVIRCGLHASDNVEGERVGGFYHPAFKELCESAVYRDIIEQSIPSDYKGKLTAVVSPAAVSKAMGHKKSNQQYFKAKGIDMSVKQDKQMGMYQCRVIRG